MVNVMPDFLLNYSVWVHSLPAIAQPVVTAFTPSLPVWLGIAVFERRWVAAHGASPAKLSVWVAMPACGALFYFRDRYPEARAILDWPDRHIPGWHLHWWQMVIGCLLAGFVAKWLEAAFAALFLRTPRQRPGTGMSGPLPVPPGFIGQYWSSSTRTTTTYEEE